MRSRSSGGSVKASAAARCTGWAGADQTSLAMEMTASRSPDVAGKRATPIRQPPNARLLLKPVVMTVRSGASSAGEVNKVDEVEEVDDVDEGPASSKIKS